MIDLYKSIKDKSSLIGRAYEFASHVHASQKRVSGDPYINHSVATAEALASWGLDETTIAAGLLHDTVEDTYVTSEDIEREFGKEIKLLVDGVTKLDKIKYRGEEEQADNIRHMILAMAEDIRVIFIKLADRKHNMSTLGALPPQKQKRIALETSEIYAPLAYRLGMQGLSGELEDMALPYTRPKEYDWLTEHVRERYEEREKYMTAMRPAVELALNENGIKPITIDFRAKRYSSILKKLQRYDMDLDKIYDLVAFRIIVSNIEECYAVLGLIHKLWPPVPGRIKDYIAMPKPNGYRSLHTTVMGPKQRFIEFQIRTKEMNEQAENGIAAHWAYKEKKGGSEYNTRTTSFANERELAWVKQLHAWQNEFADSKEFLDSLKIDFFKDRIFVITPKGEIVDLPYGATPVDFAYRIHTTLGNQCSGAKVNDKIVTLDHKLQSQDIVEVLTQKGKKPSVSWLNFVMTGYAKKKIKAALRSQSGLLKKVSLKTELKIISESSMGIMKEITAIISRSHVDILQINSSSEHNGKFNSIKIMIDTVDRDKISKLLVKLKKIKEIKEIEHRLL